MTHIYWIETFLEAFQEPNDPCWIDLYGYFPRQSALACAVAWGFLIVVPKSGTDMFKVISWSPDLSEVRLEGKIKDVIEHVKKAQIEYPYYSLRSWFAQAQSLSPTAMQKHYMQELGIKLYYTQSKADCSVLITRAKCETIMDALERLEGGRLKEASL